MMETRCLVAAEWHAKMAAAGSAKEDISATTVRVTVDSFSTFGCPNNTVTSGKVYYEYTYESLGNNPSHQVGWASSEFQHVKNQRIGDGVGDDTKSFGADGLRNTLWHNGSRGSYGIKWGVGDTIGMAGESAPQNSPLSTVNPPGCSFTRCRAPSVPGS